MEIIAKPWKRYGKHRTYFTSADESRLGFYDHKADVLTVEDETFRPDLEAWVAALSLSADAEPPGTSAAPPVSPGLATEPAAVSRPAAPETPGSTPAPRPYRTPGALALAKAATLPPEQVEPWLLGAAGEQAVGVTLDDLPEPWVVFHAVPLGDPDAPTGDLDHLVVGPAGVFVLNTKHHPGAPVFVKGDMVMVARRSQPYMAAARRDSMAAAVRLSASVGSPVTVTAALVFVGADEVVVRFAPRDVVVTTRGQVLDVLTRRRASLDPDALTRIAAAAADPSTWR